MCLLYGTVDSTTVASHEADQPSGTHSQPVDQSKLIDRLLCLRRDFTLVISILDNSIATSSFDIVFDFSNIIALARNRRLDYCSTISQKTLLLVQLKRSRN
jgi:hypothetical protein